MIKRKYLIIISIAIVVALLGSLVYVRLITQGEGKKGMVKIISVTHTPQSPMPGEKITIEVVVENRAEAYIECNSYFAGGSIIGGDMKSVDEGIYEHEFGPFGDGTEVWYMVLVAGYDGTFIVSDDYTIQIGKIERSDITTLTILNVHQSPQSLTTNDTSLTVWADITSNVTISSVEFMYMFFYPGGTSCGSGKMTKKTENTYEYFMSEHVLHPRHDSIYIDYPKGTKVFYRVVAQDESGNTAVSPTCSFVIS